MATPLFWKSFALYENIYRFSVHSHKISIDFETETFVVKNDAISYKHYIKILLFSEMIFACLYIVLKYIFIQNSVHALLAMLTFEFGIVMVLASCFCYLGESVGNELFGSFYNKLLQFDRNIRGDKRPVGYASELHRSQLILQGTKHR